MSLIFGSSKHINHCVLIIYIRSEDMTAFQWWMIMWELIVNQVIIHMCWVNISWKKAYSPRFLYCRVMHLLIDWKFCFLIVIYCSISCIMSCCSLLVVSMHGWMMKRDSPNKTSWRNPHQANWTSNSLSSKY